MKNQIYEIDRMLKPIARRNVTEYIFMRQLPLSLTISIEASRQRSIEYDRLQARLQYFRPSENTVTPISFRLS